MPQKRPEGPLADVVEDWIRDVRSRMAVRRINNTALGRMLDPPVSRQAISDMLAPLAPGEVRQSRLVPAVNAALGISSSKQRAVAHGDLDMYTARLIAAAQILDEESRAELASIAERLARLHAKNR